MKGYLEFWNNPDLKEQHKLIAGTVPWDKSEQSTPGHWEAICTPLIDKQLPVDGKVAELGCGIGRILKYLSNNFKYSLTGYDISPNMLKAAKSYLNNNKIHLKLSKGDLGKADVFDFVYSFVVFQHMPTKAIVQQNLREIHKILKDGGLVRVQTHKGQPYDESKFGSFHGHWYPDMDSFAKEFTDIGFEVLERDEDLSYKNWLWITAKK